MSFQSRAVRPRLEGAPGEKPRAPRGKLPASSQRPGKQTNQTITYARHSFLQFDDSPIAPAKIEPGDVVFVHRTGEALGHGSSRPTKIASLAQVNAMLRSGRIGVSRLHPSMRDALLRRRRFERDAMLKAIDTLAVEAAAAARRQQPLSTSLFLEDQILRAQTTYIREVEVGTKPDQFVLQEDWKALTVLDNWRPDGIVVSSDPENDSMSEKYEGVLHNVAVQGPAAAKNYHDLKEEPLTFFTGTRAILGAHQFDPTPVAGQAVYACLVAYGGKTAIDQRFVEFQYKLTSDRILDHWQRAFDARVIGQPQPASWFVGYPRPDCMSGRDFVKTVAVWKIGTVMDTAFTTGHNSKLTINVSVALLSHSELARRFPGAGKLMLKLAAVEFNASTHQPIYASAGEGGAGEYEVDGL